MTHAAIWARQAQLLAANRDRQADHRKTVERVLIKIEDLERTDEWGVYRTLVTARLTQAESMLDAARSKLLTPLSTDDLIAAQRDALCARERVTTLQEILAIPETIRQQAATG